MDCRLFLSVLGEPALLSALYLIDPPLRRIARLVSDSRPPERHARPTARNVACAATIREDGPTNDSKRAVVRHHPYRGTRRLRATAPFVQFLSNAVGLP